MPTPSQIFFVHKKFYFVLRARIEYDVCIYFSINDGYKNSFEKIGKRSRVKSLRKQENKLHKNLSKIADILLPQHFLNAEKQINFPVDYFQQSPEFINACEKYLGYPNKLLLEDSWESVGVERSNKTFIYSAFLDKRESLFEVKLIAISKGVKSYSENIKYCYLWFNDTLKPEISVVQQILFPETHNKLYASFVFNCFWKNQRKTPFAVSLSTKKCTEQKHFFKVKDNSIYMENSIGNFTVCVPPLHHNYNDASQMLEMIEINKIFGANHFTFYKYSIGNEVSDVLESYKQDNMVEVLNWNVPVNVDPFPDDPTIEVEIHYFAQLSALNDCLYRNMMKYKFIVFSDMDEIIVPQLHANWFEMLRHASAEWYSYITLFQDTPNVPSIIGSFLIRNVFIPLQWPENMISNQSRNPSNMFDESTKELLKSYKINTALKTHCEKRIYPAYIRSKYIVRSHVTKLVAVHQVMKFINLKSIWQISVETHTGILYHFREWTDNETEIVLKDKCERLLEFLPKYLPPILDKIQFLKS